jgi:hypothetical protein
MAWRIEGCLPCHPIFRRMRLDHPNDHPDDRKVVGSNPTSGSKTAGQRPLPRTLTVRSQQAVIPLGGSSRRRPSPASLGRSPSGCWFGRVRCGGGRPGGRFGGSRGVPPTARPRPRRRQPGRRRPGRPRCAGWCGAPPFVAVQTFWFLLGVQGGSQGVAFGGGQGLGLLGLYQPQRDQVQGADELRGQPEPTRSGDGVAQRDGPAVLQQDQ